MLPGVLVKGAGLSAKIFNIKSFKALKIPALERHVFNPHGRFQCLSLIISRSWREPAHRNGTRRYFHPCCTENHHMNPSSAHLTPPLGQPRKMLT